MAYLHLNVIGRKNRTLVDIARTMLIESKLPQKIWADVVDTLCYVTNRFLTKTLINKNHINFSTRKIPS